MARGRIIYAMRPLAIYSIESVGLSDGECRYSGRIGEAEVGRAGGGVVDVAILTDPLERL